MCLLATVVTGQSLFTFPLKGLAHFARLLSFPPHSYLLQAEQILQFLQPCLTKDTEKNNGTLHPECNVPLGYLPSLSPTK